MINKEKNQLLQITLNKRDYQKLIDIQEELSNLFLLELNKSQTIAFLIKNYGKTATKEPILKENKQNKGLNYQGQVIALKDKLNVSYTRLSEILGIPTSTLKKYANGSQQPKGENEKLLIDALKKYGIK